MGLVFDLEFQPLFCLGQLSRIQIEIKISVGSPNRIGKEWLTGWDFEAQTSKRCIWQVEWA